MMAPLERKLWSVKWGEYNIGNLFKLKKVKSMLSKAQLSFYGSYPVYSSESTNNGIIGYTNNPEFICNETTPVYVTFGDHTRTFNIAQESFSVLDNVKVLVPSTNNIKCLLFIVAVWQSQIPNLGYSRHWKVAKDCELHLPQTTTGEVDFDFMERFVCEIEYLRVQELEGFRKHKLEAYLNATGLYDYHLTNNESSVLANFHSLHWGEFCIGDLFVKTETRKLPYMAKKLPKQPTGKYTLPCLTSSFKNQGLNYYVPREGATILNNAISIPSNSDVYRAYYQPNDFTVLSDSYAIRWKNENDEIQPLQYMFMVACINKVTDLPIYSYKNKLGGWNVVKKKHITLPVTDEGKPDFTVMEQLIAALQKVVIADVAKYTSRYVDATRQVIESEQSTQNKEIELSPKAIDNSDIKFGSMMAAEPFECYKWEGFDKSICDFFGSDKTILIGCYKGKKYEDWINTHKIYNIRLGNTKGSMEANRKLFDSTSLLVLYELGKPNKLSAYKIVGNKEMGKEELLAMDYPNKKPRKNYMTFSITPLEMDLTFLVEHHLIERIIELNSDNAKGTPVFIQP